MTIAADLARILTRASFDELPPLAVDHAAMLVSSTIASAAAGYGIASSGIIRALVKAQGGSPESSIWFDSGPVSKQLSMVQLRNGRTNTGCGARMVPMRRLSAAALSYATMSERPFALSAARLTSPSNCAPPNSSPVTPPQR